MPIHALRPKSRYVHPKLRVVVDALAEAATAPQSGFNPQGTLKQFNIWWSA